jgi:hypothetical protein
LLPTPPPAAVPAAPDANAPAAVPAAPAATPDANGAATK